MAITATKFHQVGDRELTMDREFDAPRDLVWKAWTEPEHLAHWWGPREWTTHVKVLELRPGGVWHYCMRSPKGEEAWGKAVYEDVVRPERLKYRDAFSDADGNINPPTMVVTITLTAMGERTRLNGHTLFETPEDRSKVLEMGMEQGMSESVERLVEHLATMR